MTAYQSNMVFFEAVDTKVCVHVHTLFGVDKPVLALYWDAMSDVSALALARHLQTNLDHTLQRIRSQAYQEGWEAARSHKKGAKATSFSSALYVDQYDGATI